MTGSSQDNQTLWEPAIATRTLVESHPASLESKLKDLDVAQLAPTEVRRRKFGRSSQRCKISRHNSNEILLALLSQTAALQYRSSPVSD